MKKSKNQMQTGEGSTPTASAVTLVSNPSPVALSGEGAKMILDPAGARWEMAVHDNCVQFFVRCIEAKWYLAYRYSTTWARTGDECGYLTRAEAVTAACRYATP